MQVKLLHDLVEELAGVDTGRIVEILFGKKDVNEFLIAKKMELTINQVRNILYKLSADGLVSFIRKKDKRKGWYIYYWTLKTEKCLVKLEGSLERKIDGLNHVLGSRETKRFYICKPCEIEVGEEKALEHGFSCEECAEVYELSDNSGPIREARAKVSRVERNLKLIRGELEAIREKERKKRARADKKADKAEAERKAMMKAVRAAARKKVADAKKKAAVKVKVAKKAKKKVKKVVKKVKKKVVKKVKKKVVKKVKKKVVKKKVAPKKKVVKKKVGLAGKLKSKLRRKK
jgi:transcription factor E